MNMWSVKEKMRAVTANTFFHLSLIVAAGIIAYSNTFHVPFVFDDLLNIPGSPLIKNIDNFIFPAGGYKGYMPRLVAYFPGTQS